MCLLSDLLASDLVWSFTGDGEGSGLGELDLGIFDACLLHFRKVFYKIWNAEFGLTVVRF